MLFDDILHSRKIIQKLDGIDDYLQKIKTERDSLEDSLRKKVKENLNIKEALKEDDVKYRVKNVNLKKKT